MCGTAGVWRKSCVADAGGWRAATLTEDLDLSLRAQLAGWRFVFLPQVCCPAELPDTMLAFRLQQGRWAQGTLQTARKLLPRLLCAPLPAAVRLETAVHLTSNIAYPLVLVLAALMPPSVMARAALDSPWMLLLDVPAFFFSTFSVALFYGVAARLAAGTTHGRLGRLLPVMGLGLGMSVGQSRAVLRGLLSDDRVFLRTPKRGSGAREYRPPDTSLPVLELAICGHNLLGAVRAVQVEAWGSVPFLLLFGWGFGYVGVLSLVEQIRAHRDAPAQPDRAAPRPRAPATPRPASNPVVLLQPPASG